MKNSNYDNIKIPSNIDDRVNEGVKKALDKKKQNKKKTATIIAASISLIVILGISNPSFAENIPIIGNVFKLIEDKVYSPAKYSKYATSINETVSSNGISITLSEAVSDGRYLYVTYVIESETPFKYIPDENEEFLVQELFIKSKPSFEFTDEEVVVNSTEGKFINEYTFVAMQTYDLYIYKDKLPDSFKFKTEITSLENYDIIKDGEYYDFNKNAEMYVVNGSWKFEVPVNVTRDITTIVELNDFGDTGIESMTISKTPFNIIVDLNYNYLRIPHFEVCLYDDNGERLYSTGSSGDYYNRRYQFITPQEESNKIRVSIEKIKYEFNKDTYKTESKVEDIIYDKEVNLN